MSILVWIMIAIALWHFTVYVPDKFAGGIVGAFGAAMVGSIIVALIINGFQIPGREQMGLEQAFIAIPGSLIGLAIDYYVGARAEEQAAGS